MLWFKRKSKATKSSSFSEFIRNASSAEKKRVYKQVLKEASKRQNQILAQGSPNVLTAETILKARRGVDVFEADNAANLINKLDI